MTMVANLVALPLLLRVLPFYLYVIQAIFTVRRRRLSATSATVLQLPWRADGGQGQVETSGDRATGGSRRALRQRRHALLQRRGECRRAVPAGARGDGEPAPRDGEPYAYEHIFIDNASTDRTVEILRGICGEGQAVKVIVNTRNFGHIRSPYHGLLQARGDAVICIVADLQDPPEMIRDSSPNGKRASRSSSG